MRSAVIGLMACLLLLQESERGTDTRPLRSSSRFARNERKERRMASQQSATSGQKARKGEGGAPPVQQTARDELYGLVSVLYHALQGAETDEQYVADAKRAGDDELAAFFIECCERQAALADEAKSLLSERLEDEVEEEDEETIDDA